MESAKICVIGAGASGMMAAITAAGCGADVLLIERNDRVGKKILATGNGKCNFSHRNIQKSDYYGSFSEDAELFFKRFGVDDMLHFLENAGMLWKDRNGYLYPYSEQAATVLDTFRFMLEASKIRIISQTCIDQIKVEDNKGNRKFTLFSDGKKVAVAEKVILATGGMASPTTGSDGIGFHIADDLWIDYQKPVPALTKFVCSDRFCKELAGVRSEAEIRLYCSQELVAKEQGEIQFVEFGLSGIPVFQISRIVSRGLVDKNQKFTCELDLFPQYTEEQLTTFLLHKMNECIAHRMTCEAFLSGLMNKKIAGYFGKFFQMKYDALLTSKDLNKIPEFTKLCKAFGFHITDVKGFEQAQVTAGGILRNAVTDDLEAKKCKGLYFAGELLDMDGKCGGYNLQWAWTSGVIAGRAAANAEIRK